MERSLRCKVILLLILSVIGSKTNALELFGVDLQNSQRDELRRAAKKAGVKLIRKGGDRLWYDSYDSSAILPLSQRLYIGFVKQDKRFAFAEYEFVGFRHAQILRNLGKKYGRPKITSGTFISDQKYRWNRDGIEISLYIDWNKYRTRLVYIEPVALAALKKEQLAERSKVLPNKLASDISVY